MHIAAAATYDATSNMKDKRREKKKQRTKLEGYQEREEIKKEKETNRGNSPYHCLIFAIVPLPKICPDSVTVVINLIIACLILVQRETKKGGKKISKVILDIALDGREKCGQVR